MTIDRFNTAYLVATAQISRLVERARAKLVKADDARLQIVEEELLDTQATVTPKDVSDAFQACAKHLATVQAKLAGLIKELEQHNPTPSETLASTNWGLVGDGLIGKSQQAHFDWWKITTNLAVSYGLVGYWKKVEMRLQEISDGSKVLTRIHQQCGLTFDDREMHNVTHGNAGELSVIFTRQIMRMTTLSLFLLTIRTFEIELRKRGGTIFVGFGPKPAEE